MEKASVTVKQFSRINEEPHTLYWHNRKGTLRMRLCSLKAHTHKIAYSFERRETETDNASEGLPCLKTVTKGIFSV